MPHIHTIDNKVITYEDATCPICHPEMTRQTKQEERELLPRVYRKGPVIVVKLSKLTMITTNYYDKASCFLFTLQQIMRDQKNKIIFGTDQKPMWKKITVRLNPSIAKDYINQFATLINEVETQTPAPKRD